MRTTLELEDDVLLAAKEIAHRRGLSLGKIHSDLARQALLQNTSNMTRNGAPLFPVQPDARFVTLEQVNKLRDEAT